MPLILEDGTGVATANSYALVATADQYHTDRANTAWLTTSGDKAASLIRATQYIEAKYRNRWPGMRTKYRGLQALSWPRFGAYVDMGSDPRLSSYGDSRYDYDNRYAVGVYYIQPTEIPIELIQATCEAALRELVNPGFLQPDLTNTRTKNERAGDTEFDYFNGYPSPPLITVINSILAPILLQDSRLFGRKERAS